MLLRPTTDDTYRVVGPCFIHGLMNSEAVLGRLLPSTQVRVAANNDGVFQPRYMDPTTSSLCSADPRLADVPVPEPWEPVKLWQWTNDDPTQCVKYRNTVTGEVINTDPRMFPDALRSRGLNLRNIVLS
jgi:hypothetical protein